MYPNQLGYRIVRFFDNLQIVHTRGPLLETNDYYPFGLGMAGISSKAVKGQYATNRYRYSRKELQNQEFIDGSGLEEYDFGARFSDPQLGRFLTVDPLLEKFSSATPYNYCLNNPINYNDPTGMLANYNWYTQKYEENGQEVSWDNVKQECNIGEYAKSSSVMLFPTFGKSESPRDPGGAIEETLKAARDLPEGNVKILQVRDINDAVKQIAAIPGEISNLFISSHGFGPDEKWANAYFAIGSTMFNKSSDINVKYSNQFTKIAAKLSSGAEIVLQACHAGAAHNHGIELISSLAKKMNATVYGNQSWTAACSTMFNNGGWFSRRTYPDYSGMPKEHNGAKNYSQALANEGKWSKATPDGNVKTITNVYFDAFAKIHYD